MWVSVLTMLLLFIQQRLSGASLLILANKQDIKGALTPEEIAKVRLILYGVSSLNWVQFPEFLYRKQPSRFNKLI